MRLERRRLEQEAEGRFRLPPPPSTSSAPPSVGSRTPSRAQILWDFPAPTGGDLAQYGPSPAPLHLAVEDASPAQLAGLGEAAPGNPAGGGLSAGDAAAVAAVVPAAVAARPAASSGCLALLTAAAAAAGAADAPQAPAAAGGRASELQGPAGDAAAENSTSGGGGAVQSPPVAARRTLNGVQPVLPHAAADAGAGGSGPANASPARIAEEDGRVYHILQPMQVDEMLGGNDDGAEEAQGVEENIDIAQHQDVHMEEEAAAAEDAAVLLPPTPKPVNPHRRERAGDNCYFSSLAEILDAVMDDDLPVLRRVEFNHPMGTIMFVHAGTDRTEKDQYRRLWPCNPYGSDARKGSPFCQGRTPVKYQIYVLRPNEEGYQVEPQSFIANTPDGPIIRRRFGQQPEIIPSIPEPLEEWRLGITRYHSASGTFHLKITEILRGPGEGFFAIQYLGVKPVITDELWDWYDKVEAWETKKKQGRDGDGDGGEGGAGGQALPVN